MNWPTAKLGSLCDKIGSGITPRGGASVYVEEGVALIRSQNIYNSDFSYAGLAFLSDAIATKMAGVTVHENDVLLNITGDSVARCTMVPVDTLPARVNQHVAIIRPKSEELNPKYLASFLVSSFMQATMLSWAGSGGTRKALTKGMIENFDIPLPDIASQNRIASILSAYDNLIANNRRRNELLENAVRLLYREWFINFRFPGHEHVTVNDGVPDGWRETRLGDVAKTNPENHKAKKLPEKLNYIDISSVSTGSIDTKTEMSAADAPGRARRIARHGDIIWSNVRPNLRAYALVLHPAENDVFSTGFTILRSDILNPWYLYCVVTSKPFVDHLINHATGTSYPAVRPEDFENAKIVVPSDSLLEAFEEICRPQFEQMAKLKTSSRQAAAARDILLPRLMDGRIEV